MSESNLGPGEVPTNPDAPLVSVPAPARTVGVSPKLWAAVLSAVAAYLLGQEVLELPPLAVLALNVVIVGGAVFRAGPGETVPSDVDLPSREAGYSLVEVLVAAILLVLLIWLMLHLASLH